VTDLKEKLQQILSLSLSISDSINDNSNSNSSGNINSNSNKRVKISNDNGYDIIDITSSNITKAASSNNTANSNINSTNTTTSASSSIRTHISRIPPYNPNIEINWLLQFDGGSRGNPGPAGAGAVLYQTGIVILTMLTIIKLMLIHNLRSSYNK
jgi:hypothetical protein